MINQQALKDRLQVIAKSKKIPFNACWKQLLLERFLARLAASPHSNNLIFKGGFLLSYLMEIGRETTDLDFLLTRMKAEEPELRDIFKEIISIHSEDGFIFSLHSITLLSQPHMDYPGYHCVLNTTFANMRDKIQIDIGVGDVVEPLTRELPLVQYRGKPFFENAVSLLVYPTETIFSEKLETILSKGSGNSRMKDYHDLILLIRNQSMLSLEKLQETITHTFSNRGTVFQSIEFDTQALEPLQRLWTAHLQGLGKKAESLDLPKDMTTVIEEINQYIAVINKTSKVKTLLLATLET